jgi:pimeloyl-ACP methyl ester carboxylesterase
LVNILSHLSLSSYILAGLSYGTALIAETAPELKGCRGFFMASPNITSDAYPPRSYIIPFPELQAMISGTVEDDVLRRFATHLAYDPSSPIVDLFCTSYRATDPQFRIELGVAMQNGSWSDEFKNLIHSGIPVSYLFGENDRAMDIHYMDAINLPRNHVIHYIDNAAHFINYDRHDQYNGLLKMFCSSLLK